MKTYNLHIETERLILRPFNVDDIEAAYLMNLDEQVSRYTGDGGVASKAEIKRRIEEDVIGDYQKYGFGRFAVELKSSGDFIGFSGLKYLGDLDLVDLGFRFMSQYWGQGYATESALSVIEFGFRDLNLEEIYAFVLEENTKSIHVLNKLGFLFEKEIMDLGILAQKYVLSKKQNQ